MGLIEKFLHNLKAPRWGVHPDDHKRPAADAPLRELPLPKRLYIPLQQHVGQPARPIVLVGQKVLRGQLIAEAQGNISAPVHASASGKVVSIGEITAPHPSGSMPMATSGRPDGCGAVTSPIEATRPEADACTGAEMLPWDSAMSWPFSTVWPTSTIGRAGWPTCCCNGMYRRFGKGSSRSGASAAGRLWSSGWTPQRGALRWCRKFSISPMALSFRRWWFQPQWPAWARPSAAR